jgi:DNA-binding transcriptional regulator YdaS (Cro superfamily)
MPIICRMEAIERAIKHFGSQAALASALGIRQPTISEWLRGERPVPEGRCPEIEQATGGAVRCEDLLPGRWVRIADPAWPHGKPLLDKTTSASAVAQETEASGQPYSSAPCSTLCQRGECAVQKRCMQLQREQVLHEAGEA